MSAIALIKELRDRTGAGFMDCKTALAECNDDIEKAVDWIRKKGLSVALKKSGRSASEGLVAIKVNDKGAFIIEVNSETDFVAKNESFCNLTKGILSSFVNSDCDNVEKLLKEPFQDKGSVEDVVTQAIATIGENIVIRRCDKILQEDGCLIAAYIHNKVEDNLGKIGNIVKLACENIAENKEKLQEAAKFIAMHVSAMQPIAISSEEISQDLIDREKGVIREKEMNEGITDPEKLDFLVNNKIKGFFKTSALLNQPYICHNKLTVGGFLKELSKEIGACVTVKKFVRLSIGEES